MPKRRPIDFLKRLGRRIRARRLHVNRTLAMVAQMAEVSKQQIRMYESGLANPPAASLHRVALALGTSSSALLGEQVQDHNEQFDILVKLYSDPTIGAVTRYMQDMTKEDRQSLQVIASSLAGRRKPVETIEAMR